jgi:serine/threonine protein phosphatase PrpC
MYQVSQDVGMRTYMEDRSSVDLNLCHGYQFFAVFDGHGGPEVSSYLKTHMKEAVKELLNKHTAEHGSQICIPTVLHEAFDKIVDDIPYIIAVQTGSTAVVVLIKDNDIWVANCGDSRAIINEGEKAVPLTSDHKPNRTDEYFRITRSGGQVTQSSVQDVPRVNGVLAVSRSIGDFALAPFVSWMPEITQYTFTEKNNYIVLATDGVWDVLSNEDVIHIINNAIVQNQPKKVGESIISLSRLRHSQDNICIVIAFL